MTEAGAAEPSAKRVSWAELLFDLVFVFAVTQVAALLRRDHSGAGLAHAVIVFVPIWWAWVGTAIHTNRHDVDTTHDRLGIFALGLVSLGLALAVPGAFGSRGPLFGASYLLLRLILALLVFREWRGIRFNAFAVGALVTGPLLLLGGLVPAPARTVIWAVAGAVDLVGPWLLRRRLATVQFEIEHLPERFGLFLIIALGESVVQIGAAASNHPLTVGRMLAVALAYALICALWWVYFVFAVSAVRHALAIAPAQAEVLRPVLSYGHLVFICAIIAVAVGLSDVVTVPTGRLGWSAAGLLVGGCALYLATFGYTRWRMFRRVSSVRLAAAALCLLFLPLARALPGLATLLVLVVITVALNGVEAAIVRRYGTIEDWWRLIRRRTRPAPPPPPHESGGLPPELSRPTRPRRPTDETEQAPLG